jgi:tRNA-splicing ligase RtcB (3'-phosphate/5'-hydroxy nucleic acid ligase)
MKKENFKPINVPTDYNRIRVYVHSLDYPFITDPLERIKIISHANKLKHDIVGLPDFHYKVGNFIPTGTVCATEPRYILPCAVGNGAGCGYSLIRTGLNINDVSMLEIDRLFKQLLTNIPIYNSNNLFTERFCLDIMNEGLDAVKSCSVEEKQRYDYCGNIFPEHAWIKPDKDYKKFIPTNNYKAISASLGALGGLNHFLELVRVEDIVDKEIAKYFGLSPGALYINLHADSNKFSRTALYSPYKTFRNWERIQQEIMRLNFHIKFYKHPFYFYRQKELFTLSIKTLAGRRFLSFIFASTNYGASNRYIISKNVINILTEMFKSAVDPGIVVDNVHDLISFENGLWVHRSGATRIERNVENETFKLYRKPVLIPIAMGGPTLFCIPDVGIKDTYDSLPHGAGRLIDRSIAKNFTMESISKIMEQNNILLYRKGSFDITREHPDAFRKATPIRETLENYSLAKVIAVFKPVAILKG